jgi:hypothetical protein
VQQSQTTTKSTNAPTRTTHALCEAAPQLSKNRPTASASVLSQE